MSLISLSNRQRQQQLDFLGVTKDDVHIVHSHRTEMMKAVRRVMAQLPDHLNNYTETRRVLEGHSIERHRNAVGGHMASLANGLIDDAYIDKRLTVGQVHDEVKLAPHWYMSAFQMLFTAFTDELTVRYRDQADELAEVLKAFGKLFNLDMQLILEAYFESYEATIRHLAYYDALTGYPNRVLFEDRLHAALRRAGRSGGKAALLFIDLDRFKTINDTFGHAAGDRLLAEAARCMDESIRESDTLARLGGDEFAILATDIQSDDEPARIAHRIMQAMEDPFHIEGTEIRISPSIGIALFPADGTDAATLLERADVAMYEAKRSQTGYRFYTGDMHDEVAEQLATEQALRHAVERDELALHYQPQFELATKRLIGFEALLRWHRAGETWMRPDQFIPVAEESGLIVPIGDWVLETAVQQLKAWHDTGHSHLKMSVNLSPIQLRAPDFAERIAATLAENDVPPSALELEITESVTLNSADVELQTLARLKEMGLTILIDDFGTGYSSLRYLKDLPIDGLKIDRSFVSAMTEQVAASGIIEMMVTLCRTLQLTIIAEGVETEHQLERLKEMGCDHVQGFLLGKPMTPRDAEELIFSATKEPLGIN